MMREEGRGRGRGEMGELKATCRTTARTEATTAPATVSRRGILSPRVKTLRTNREKFERLRWLAVLIWG